MTDSNFGRAPTHAGGLFAIDRSYFLEIGAYDPGLLVWGGENFELSFKVSFLRVKHNGFNKTFTNVSFY